MPAARKARWLKQVALLLAAAVLLFLVALGAHRPTVGDIVVERRLDEGLVMSIMLVVLAGCCLIALGALAYLLLGVMRGPWHLPLRPAGAALPWWLKTIVFTFAAACIAGIVIALVRARGGIAPPVVPQVLPPTDQGGGGNEGPPAVVVQWWVLAVVAFVAATAAAVFFFVARWQRRAQQIVDESPGRRELGAAVDTSLADLEEALDCRAAVIRAYAGMERVLADHGLARRESEAPFEYLARWTSALKIGHSTAGALTTLYEWAKFSPHSVDEHMRHEATQALRALRRELEGGAG